MPAMPFIESALFRSSSDYLKFIQDAFGIEGLQEQMKIMKVDYENISYWQARKMLTINQLKASKDIPQILKNKLIAEYEKMSLFELGVHTGISYAWQGVTIAPTFGSAMYFLRPILYESLMTFPGLADIQNVIQKAGDILSFSEKPWLGRGLIILFVCLTGRRDLLWRSSFGNRLPL